VNTLSSSPLLANRDYTTKQIRDLSDKLEQAEGQLAHSGRMGGGLMPERKKEESPLAKITKDTCAAPPPQFLPPAPLVVVVSRRLSRGDRIRTSTEQIHGLMSQVMKDILFNGAFAQQPATK
jgi:COP9 signalosome complex subunit 5